MPFAFQKVQLEAKGFFDLIGTWAEMQLIISDDSAKIIGDGYTFEIAEAFTILVFDWEATIPLSKDKLDIPVGSYDLILQKGTLYACKNQQSFPLSDQQVVVEVLSVPEE